MGPEQWELGRTLQDAREKRGLSIRGTARLADISEGWVRQIEYGWRKKAGEWIAVEPSAEVLVRLATTLDLPPQDVLTAAGLGLSGVEREREIAHILIDKIPDSRVFTITALLRDLAAGS